LFDPIITLLIEKLADGNGRLREGGRQGLEVLAAAGPVGPSAVVSHAIRALPPKQKTAWRPIAARLQLLTDLVTNYGIGGASGISVDSVLSFPKANGAYAHSAVEVRDDAKRLVVAVQRKAGTPAIEPVMALLRQKQKEEYLAAFEAVDGRGGPNPNHGNGNGNGNSAAEPAAAPKRGPPASSSSQQQQGSPTRVDKHLQHATHAPGGKVPTSAAKGARHEDRKAASGGAGDGGEGGGGGADPQDFTTCMFCGMHDKGWTENDMDVHYWKDCPLLISCPSCAQIVEIAGLPEHLLDECDEKDSYVPCETTGRYFALCCRCYLVPCSDVLCLFIPGRGCAAFSLILLMLHLFFFFNGYICRSGHQRKRFCFLAKES
jgi:centrosomal protein CEP104